MDENQTETLIKAEPQLVTVKKSQGEGKRMVARGLDGKFAARHRAAVKKNISDVVKFFEGKPIDPETGKPLSKTRHEMLLDKIYETMMAATGEELIGLSRAYAELQKAAYGAKGKEKVIEQSDPVNNQIRVILVQPPDNLMFKEVKKEIVQPTKPSFIDAEIVSTNPRSTNEQ
jgi:hypothetical protein